MIADRGSDAVLPTYGPRPLALVAGRGCTVVDEDGREYLDLVAGVAVACLGHGHPEPLAALTRQWQRLTHVSNLFWSEPGVALAERLVALTGLERAFLCNSGAEANEAAIKLARRVGRARGGPGKHEIVCFDRGFHGRTLGALSATDGASKRAPFEPLLPGFVHVDPDDPDAVVAAVGATTAAVLAEPVQGEGGVFPVPIETLRAARVACDTHDALLLFDEVQTGLGRCGAWFAFQRFGVRPDAITLAKGLGGGVPIGALVAGALPDGFVPGEHGSTFGGSPPVAAAALAVLEVIERDGLVRRADALGSRIADELRAALGAEAVRGVGLLLAVEVGDAVSVATALREDEGILVNAVTSSAIRLCPPLVLSDAEADRAVAAIVRVTSGSDR